MANILIIGDSWGITPSHRWHQEPEVVSRWFEYLWLQRGHATFNKSWGGNQNHYQLAQAQVFLKGTEGTAFFPDLIIWFHTELMRDLNPPLVNQIEELGIDSVMELTADEVYGSVTKMHQRWPTVKWAILGGHAPILASRRHLLSWAEYLEPNLRSKIAGQTLPETQYMEWLEPWKGSLWDYKVPQDIIDRELANREIIRAATADTEKFYNAIHPGQASMQLLFDELVQHFDL